MSNNNSSNLDSLSALILPLTDRHLLIPNIALAELIEYVEPKIAPNLPKWHLGHIYWRGLNVPLLSFELASGGTYQPSPTARIAILNAISGSPKRKFIALILRDLPSTIKVDHALKHASLPAEKLEFLVADVNNTAASIPDLVALENMLDTI